MFLAALIALTLAVGAALWPRRSHDPWVGCVVVFPNGEAREIREVNASGTVLTLGGPGPAALSTSAGPFLVGDDTN